MRLYVTCSTCGLPLLTVGRACLLCGEQCLEEEDTVRQPYKFATMFIEDYFDNPEDFPTEE